MLTRMKLYYKIKKALKQTLVEKRAVLPVLNRLQSRFWNRDYEIGTKGPSFSPGFTPGTKGAPLVPVDKTNRD